MKRKKNMTFRKHWGIWILIYIAIILFLILAYFTYGIILDDTIKHFNQHQYIIARNSVDKIKHHMEEITYAMEKLKSASKEVEIPDTNEYYLISTYPMLDSKRELKNLIHIIRDITGTKNLEKQLLQAQKMESLGTLAGGIAHDFNNILTGVLGNASFLKSFINPQDKIYKYVERIENAATRAAELTQQLIGFARGGKYQVKPINMNKIIDEIIGLLQRSLDKSISIEKA